MTGLFRFIGQDGNLGYIKGEVYCLEIRGHVKPVIVAPIIPRPKGYPEYDYVPYDSWNKFLENWEIVR